jgi:hypothetical protein
MTGSGDSRSVRADKNSRDFHRKRGYARGSLPAFEKLTIPEINESFSTLGALTLDGLVNYKTRTVFHGAGNTGIDTDAFLADFQAVLMDPNLPPAEQLLQPWPNKNSVILLDNCSLHHDQWCLLQRMVAAKGGLLLYLSAYSPEFNPIEMAFGAIVRANY